LVYLNPPAADSKNEEKKNGDFWKPENQATQFSPFFLRARRQWSTPRILLTHSFGPSADNCEQPPPRSRALLEKQPKHLMKFG
jgi:hypothetical protein